MQTDQPTQVRKSESIDLSKLKPYLAGINPSWDADIEVKQFPSGYSNLTYFLKVGDQEMILRRPPFGAQVKSGHDMNREYTVMKGLKPGFGKVPEVYHLCQDHSVLGCDFYLMERVNGVIVRGKGIEEGGETIYPKLSQAWIETFVEFHATDFKQAGLESLGKPDGYVRRQVEGWSRRYKKAQTDEVKEIEKTMEWLNQRIPSESDHTLIHNDYKYDNVMFSPNDWSSLIAVLDWEMATLGDPLMDFGTSLAYWNEPEDVAIFGKLIQLPTHQAGNPDKLQIMEMYANLSGRDLSNILYYYVFGLFKIAVVVQQIYYRYHHGHTDDKRFATLGMAAQAFCFKAQRAIEKNRIDQLY